MNTEILAAFEIEGATIFDKIIKTKKGLKLPDVNKEYKYGAIAKGMFESENSVAIVASKNGKTYRLALSVIFQGKPYGMNNLGELVKILDDMRKEKTNETT